MIAFAGVLVFMVLSYGGLFGGISVVALLLNGLLIIGAMSMTGATLTLPGIAAGCLLVFLPALGLFYVTDVLGGAHNLMIGALLKDQFLDARDWPFGAAASLVMIGLLFLFLALYRLAQRRMGDREGVDV